MNEVKISRLPSGFYEIKREEHPTLVGCAASTIIALTRIVFMDEAQGRAPSGNGDTTQGVKNRTHT
jgi:hypothetical protein